MDWQSRIVQIEDMGDIGLKFLGRFREPHGLQVCLDQVAVGEVDCRRTDDAAYHRFTPAEVILVVRTLCRAVGQNQRRLAGSSSPPRALSIIGWRGRHVAQIHRIECRDIDAELHGRRAEKNRQEYLGLPGLSQLLLLFRQFGAVLLAPAKAPFAPFTPVLLDLSRMLPALDSEERRATALQRISERLVKLDEI